jgi:iron complex outermembrane receptor protein
LIDTPNLDVPGSVDVITESVRADQQVLLIDDLLRDIGGAVKINDPRRADSFYLRGFEVRARDYRKNGFFDPTYTPRDFANVERVEILKGPASALYGAGQPSGSVNLITKKPLDQSMTYGNVQVGSYGLQRYTIDSTGPLNEDKNVLFRINAAYEDDDSFRDFGFTERTFVSPVLTWMIDSDTSLTWEGEYNNDRRRYDSGVALINGDVRALPIGRFLGEPSSDAVHLFDYRQTLTLNHKINEDWAWSIGGYSVFYGGTSVGTIPAAYVDGLIPPLGNDVFFRTRQNIDPWQENYQSMIANVSGKFFGDFVTHNVVLGTEQGWLTSDRFRAQQSIPDPTVPTTLLAIDAMNPIYDNPNFGMPNPATPFLFDSTYRENRHGVYVQDLMDVGEHWKVMAGVRYDHVDTMFRREIALQGLLDQTAINDQSFDHGSPRVGLVYQPIPDKISYYVTYCDSFDTPGGGPRLTLIPLKPELGQTWEGGVKAQPLDGLTVSAAGFYITKENVTVDMFDAPLFTTTQVGRQRSQGVEVEAIGQLSERWSLLSNWCYVDTLLNDSDNLNFDGRPARGVPHNTLNVWSRYNVIQEEERTLGLALGMIVVGERLGDFAQTAPPSPEFFLPGYTRWDAGIYYKRGRLDSSVYFENVFDTRYYTSSLSQYQIFPGAPFTVRAQVGYRF